MARLEFPITAGGLMCDALLGHKAGLVAAIMAAGHTAPNAVRCRAEIDTGSNVSGVSSSVLAALGLGISVGSGNTQTAAGSAPVGLHKVSLSICDFSLAPSPMLSESDLLVVQIHPPIPGVDVLIGMDIIRRCKLLVDGPAGVFSLEW